MKQIETQRSTTLEIWRVSNFKRKRMQKAFNNGEKEMASQMNEETSHILKIISRQIMKNNHLHTDKARQEQY